MRRRFVMRKETALTRSCYCVEKIERLRKQRLDAMRGHCGTVCGGGEWMTWGWRWWCFGSPELRIRALMAVEGGTRPPNRRGVLRSARGSIRPCRRRKKMGEEGL